MHGQETNHAIGVTRDGMWLSEPREFCHEENDSLHLHSTDWTRCDRAVDHSKFDHQLVYDMKIQHLSPHNPLDLGKVVL
jgi:hypothetical protein